MPGRQYGAVLVPLGARGPCYEGRASWVCVVESGSRCNCIPGDGRAGALLRGLGHGEPAWQLVAVDGQLCNLQNQF